MGLYQHTICVLRFSDYQQAVHANACTGNICPKKSKELRSIPVFSITYTRLFSPPLGQDLITKVHSMSFASKATCRRGSSVWEDKCHACLACSNVLLEKKSTTS